ncbi:MAG: SIMPL domain-containing protein [Bacteriovoracia bacterium]
MTKHTLSFVAWVGLFAANASASSIQVQGSAQQQHFADQWDITFRVLVRKPSKEEATRAYNQTKSQLEKLVPCGSGCEKLQSNFSSQLWREWVKSNYVNQGWEIQHFYTYRYFDQEKGTQDAQTLSTITYLQIDGVNAGLKRETLLKARDSVLEAAFNDALDKAKVLAKAAGKRLAKDMEITEGQAQMAPMYANDFAMNLKGAAESSRAAFSLDSTRIPVSQSVTLKANAD